MKTKKLKRVISAFLSFVMVLGLAYVPSAAAYTPTITATPAEDVTVSLLGGKIYEFASTYNAEARGTAADYCDKSNMYAPKSVTIQWEGTAEAQYCTVKIGKKADLSDAERYVLYGNKLELHNLSAATHYYYQIDAEYADKTVKSRIFEFETAALPRTVWVEGVSNTRDIGGYYSTDGQYQIKQGLVWRGAKLTEITESGKQTLLEDFGVKTVLAINDEAIDASILQDDSLNYVTVSAPYYEYDGASPGINSAEYKDALLTELRVFADEANYPVYFHCSLGRDRTGTLATLLQALCGVGEDDLYLDYELSWFSTMGWLDNNDPASMVSGPFTKLIKFLKNYGAGTLAENTAQFMLELGMTQQEIDNIRSILREEVTTQVTNRTATIPPQEEETTPPVQDTEETETPSKVPNFSLSAGASGSVRDTWTEGTSEVVNYAITGNPFLEKEVAFPEGLTNTTFSDFGIQNQTGSTHLNKTYGTTVVGNLFSGYLTFHGTGQGFFMYGGKTAWQGLRFQYKETGLQFLYVTSAGAGVDSSAKLLSAETAGVGSTFKDTKFLLQITVETVNTTDAKVGFWFNGVLYNNEYITLEGAASDLGNGIFMTPNETNMTLDVESYTKPETMPTGLTDTTFSNFNIADQEGLTWTNNTYGTTIVGNRFSGYMTFHGSGVGYFMYGGTEPWYGLRFQYKETDLVLVYVTSAGEGKESATLNAETAGVGATFKDTEFLFQITTEVVNTTDVKLGLWFDGVLYNNEYITLAGAASDLGNRIFMDGYAAGSSLDVKSYTMPQSELPIRQELNTGTTQAYLDFSGCAEGDMVQDNTNVLLIIVDENTQVIQMRFGEAAVENLRVGDRIVLKEGLPVQYSSSEKDISRLRQDYILQVDSITSDGHVKFTTASTEMLPYEFASTITQSNDTSLVAYAGGTQEVKLLSADEITSLGLAEGYDGDVYQIVGKSGQNNFGALLDFTSREIPISLVKEITFRVYVSGTPSSASYPQIRIQRVDSAGNFAMQYKIASLAGSWVDINLSENFNSSSRSIEEFAIDGKLGRFGLEIRADDANRVFCIDSVTVTLKEDDKVAPVIDCDAEEIVRHAGAEFTAFTAYDAREERQVEVQHDWSVSPFDGNGKLVQGEYTLNLTAKDIYGNTSTKQVKVYVIEPDADKPVIDVDAATVYAVTGTTPILDMPITDNSPLEPEVSFAWSQGSTNAKGQLTAGTHTLSVTATDASGNIQSKSISYVVSATEHTQATVIDEQALCNVPAETLPTGLVNTTFDDFGIADQDGVTHLNKTYGTTVVGNLFSGYLTFHGTGQGFFMYGGKSAWQGLRFQYKETKMDFLYVNSAGAPVDSSAMTIDAKTAGVGSTFKDTEFLLQITVETVNTTDAKVGFWFNGVLYNNEYITLAGAATDLGNGIFMTPNETDMTLDVGSYTPPQKLPTGLVNTTFDDFGIADQDGVIHLNKTYGTTVVGNLFSGYLTFHGTGQGFFMYGGKSAWQGLRFQYKETKMDFLYVNSAGAPVDSSAMTIDAKTAGVGSTFKDAKFLLQITVETVNTTDAKVGFWFNGVLYNNEYITLAGAATDLGNGIFMTPNETDMTLDVGSYQKDTIATLPTDRTATSFLTYGMHNGNVSDGGQSAEGDITTDLFSAYVTFYGDNIWFSYGGKNDSWAGIRFAYDGEKLNMYAAAEEFAETATFTSDIAGVDLSENRFLLQLTADKMGDDIKLGVWFDGVLYNNEYITLTAAASKLGKSIGIHQQNNDSAAGYMTIESYGVEMPKPAEELPTHLKDTTFSDYEIPDGKRIGVEKAYTTGSVVGNLFSAYVELYGTELMFNYGGSPSTWHGMRFTWDGTSLKLVSAAGEFTGSYTFTSDVARVDLSENRFLLQISVEAVDSDEDGAADDVKLGMWFDGKLYNNEYIYWTDAAANFGNKLNIVPAGNDATNNYMIIESVPKLPKNNITITPSEFGITDNRNINAAIYGELTDNITNGKISLLDKTLSMDLSYTDAWIIISGATDGDWAGLQLQMSAEKIVLANALPNTGDGSIAMDAATAGVDFTKPFNLKLTFERVNDNDLKVGAWFDGKLYNSQYKIFTNTANAVVTSMYLIPTDATALHVTAPERTVPTKAAGYEVKTLNDYGFENGTYTGATLSKEIEDLMTDKLVVSGMVEITGDGSLVLVGKDTHYCLSLGQNAETGAYYLLVNSTDGSIVAPMQIPIGDGTSNRFEFQFVQTKVDADSDGSTDDIELQVWINGVLSRSYYLSNYAEQLTNATYASIRPGTGSVSILTSLDVENSIGKYYNLAEGPYLVLIYTENAADSTDSYAVGETITTPGDYKVIYTSGGTTITNMIHLWKTGDVHPDGKISAADLVALKKMQENKEISKAGAAGADINGDGNLTASISIMKEVLLAKQTITAEKSNNASYTLDENGNVVMPISGFWGPMLIDYTADGIENNFIQDQYYQMIAESGINLINYIANNSATSSDALAQNLRNLSLAEKYGIGIYIMDTAVNENMSQTELAKHLSQYGKYSSFAGIMITDEPVTDAYNPNDSTTQKTVSEIGALSTKLNQYVNINGYTNLFGDRQDEGEFAAYVQEYIAECAPQVLSFDYYPFERNVTWNTTGNWWGWGTAAIDKGHARYFESLAVMREKSLENDLPFWSFIQAGDNFATDVENTTNNTPTKSQFMWNVNTSLAYGAKGIEYFPLLQPYYYAYESATVLDYERNGLIGANGEPTKWYDFAKSANNWIQTVDEILMESTSTGMIASGSKMMTQTGFTSSANGVTVSGGHSDYGALVGIFSYNGKTAYYVVNGNYSTTSDTATTTNAVTLTFDTAKTGVIYQQDKAGTVALNGKTASLTLPIGSAALVVVD